MTEPPNGNGSASNYSIKELLTNFVLPDLREIKEEMRTKINRAEFSELAVRVKVLEDNGLTSDDVKTILAAQQQAAREFGISKIERNIGLLIALCTVVSLVLGAHQAGAF